MDGLIVELGLVIVGVDRFIIEMDGVSIELGRVIVGVD